MLEQAGWVDIWHRSGYQPDFAVALADEATINPNGSIRLQEFEMNPKVRLLALETPQQR